MTQDELKALVGRAALEHVPSGAIIGVGSGSTVNCFIDALAESGLAIAGAVAAAGGPSVDKRKIEIGQSIKTTGDYTVSIRLHPEVSAKIGVQVVAG